MPFNDTYKNVTGYDSFTSEFIFNNNKNLKLTKREWQCVDLLLQGKSSKIIATHLNLSQRTVEHYLDGVRLKLKCRNRQELIVKLLPMTINNKCSLR